MNGDQHNGDAPTHPAAATVDGEATDGLVTSNDLPTNGVSQELRKNADQYSAKLNKSELDQLLRSLKLSDEQCSILLGALKEKNILEENIDVHVYENPVNEFVQFFHMDGRTKRLKDVAGLFGWLHYDIDPTRWILDIYYNQTKKELDCLLIDKRREYESVKFLKSLEVADPFEFLKQALEEADYEKYNWKITGEFRAVSVARRSSSFKLNQQGRRPNLIRFELQVSQAIRQTELD